MYLENLLFGFSKRYSLPVLIALYYKNGLTFDQIFSLSKEHSHAKTSRQSISRAVAELIERKYIKKETRLVKGKAYTTYTLTENSKKVMGNYFRKDA